MTPQPPQANSTPPSELHIVAAERSDHLASVRELLHEYQASLGLDPESHQIGDEMRTLPGAYGPPAGRLLLGLVGDQAAGCIAVRPYAGSVCEMKRLYVRAAYRGSGLGRQLCTGIIAAARSIGYTRMLLDTLPYMRGAQSLYESLGFREIEPYGPNLIPGVRFMALELGEIDEPVHVTEYQTTWPAEFSAEHARIVGALSLQPEDLQHIGSTAVPGLAGKPIIDLMLGVRQYPPSDSFVQRIVDLDYQSLGEAGVSGRWYFRRRDQACMNLHVVGRESNHWVQNLALRDYLRIDAQARARYALAKRQTIAAGASTLLAYSEAKAAVLATLLQEALALRSG